MKLQIYFKEHIILFSLLFVQWILHTS